MAEIGSYNEETMNNGVTVLNQTLTNKWEDHLALLDKWARVNKILALLGGL